MEMKFYITQETKQEIEAKIDVLEDKFLSISGHQKPLFRIFV